MTREQLKLILDVALMGMKAMETFQREYPQIRDTLSMTDRLEFDKAKEEMEDRSNSVADRLRETQPDAED